MQGDRRGSGRSGCAAQADRWARADDARRRLAGCCARRGMRERGPARARLGRGTRGVSGPVAGFGWAEWGRESWFGPRGKWAGGEGWTGLRWVWAGGLGFPNGLVWVSRFGFWVSFHTSSILILTQLNSSQKNSNKFEFTLALKQLKQCSSMMQQQV